MSRLVILPFVFFLLPTLVLGQVSGPGVALSDEEAQFLKTLPTQRIMADDEFAPLSRWNPEKGEYEGVAIELFRTVASRLGLSYEFLRSPGSSWKQKVDLFRAGRADLLLPMSQTPERAETGVFSSSFFETTYSAVALQSRHLTLDKAQDLSAWRVGAVKNTAIVTYLTTVVPSSQLVQVDTSRDLYAALRDGRIDFALQNHQVFQEDRYAQELFDLVAVQSIVEWPRRYAFYFSKTAEHARLVGLINRVLVTIDMKPLAARYETGLEALILRYTDQRHRQDLLVFTLVASVATLVLLSILLWNQRRLKASEARFRSLAEASFGGICIHENGLILECNQGLCDMCGFTREELLGTDGMRLIDPADQARVVQNIRAGHTMTYEVTGLRKDGTRFPVGVRGKNVPYQGRPVRVTEFFDLTGQKAAESATLKAKQQYDALVTKIPIGVYVFRSRPDGRTSFDFVSPRMAAMLGVGVDETLADMSLAFRSIHPEDRPAMEALNRQAVEGRQSFDWTGRAVQGTEIHWFHISSTPEVQDDDVVWHGIVVDITDQKRAEDQIRALLEEKELILREVHHRIKNNMSTVTGLLTLQASTLTDPGAIAAIDDAKGRVLSMMVLYDKLYLSSGPGALSLAVYLPSLVSQVVENFPNAGSVVAETQAEDVTVDARTLSSVGIIVNELLTNVMKYAFTGLKGGRILVTANLVGGRIRLVVEDNGRGLPEGFDPSHSTGFGLSLVDMLTKHLDGTLNIERVGPTRFVLEFPG